MIVVALLAAVVVPILCALVIGLKALRQSLGGGTHTMALRLLALNLCEPACNTLLVGWLIYSASSSGNRDLQSIAFSQIVLCTLPMVVLLTPIIGLFSPDTYAISWSLLGFGSARWMLTIVALTSCFGPWSALGDAALSSSVGCIFVSIVVLVATTVWATHQIDQMRGAVSTPRAAPARSSF